MDDFTVQDLVVGDHYIEIFDAGSCQVFPNENYPLNSFEILDVSVSLDDIGFETVDNVCVNNNEGAINLTNLNSDSDYTLVLIPPAGDILANSVINLSTGSYTLFIFNECGDNTSFSFEIEADFEDGCTNPIACNYNPLAGCDDNSCILPPLEPQLECYETATLNTSTCSWESQF